MRKLSRAPAALTEPYLKWLDRFVRQPREEAPSGLILRAESNREQMKLLQMHKDSNTAAEYWTERPLQAKLEQQLHQPLLKARQRLVKHGSVGRGQR